MDGTGFTPPWSPRRRAPDLPSSQDALKEIQKFKTDMEVRMGILEAEWAALKARMMEQDDDGADRMDPPSTQ
jgi:hypothetical protein